MSDLGSILLARDAADDFAAEGTGWRLTAEPRLGVARLQILAEDPDAWFEGALGVAPPPPLREIALGPVGCAWLAPGDWLVTGAEEDVERIRARAAQAAGTFGLMVDLCHARASFELEGPAARDILASHCPLDFSDRAMTVGAALRSLFSGTSFFLSRRPDRGGQPCFRLIFDQTMSGFARRMLGGAASENLL